MFRAFPIRVKVLFSNFRKVKIAANSIAAVRNFALGELKAIYPEPEVRQFIRLGLDHYFGYDAKFLSIHPDIRLTESELLKMNFLIKDLKKGKPIQYIFGETEFYGRRFAVNEHVLIPRPETEELVGLIVRENQNQSKLQILDIGTGSGCIAISLAEAFKDAHVLATDISDSALEVARRNADGFQTIEFFKDDVLNFKDEKYPDNLDIIVSNPPYVLKSEADSMHQNVLENEPHGALFVPDNEALIFYKKIQELAKTKLKSGGKLYFEINESKGVELRDFLVSNGWNDVSVQKDLNGKVRMIRAINE